MEFRLDDRAALVTGSDSGIGRSIAETYAEAGADVTVTYFTDKEGAEETVRRIESKGRRGIVVQVDVGDQDAVEHLFQQHDQEFGKLDILVNNAGMGIGGEIKDLSFDDWNRVLSTNLNGPFLCTQQAARRMLAQKGPGRIINISSVHEEACWANGGAYNVSKGGLRNLMRTAATELGPHGITVNGIAPGMILTPLNKVAISNDAYLREAEEQINVRRAGLPVDVAGMALYLASDAASYCNGSTYYVDGGWMLTWPPV